MIKFILLLLVWFLRAVRAFDCSVSELSSFDFESIKGVHSVTINKNTPPSTSIFTWNIGVCVNTDEIEHCPKNSDICGVNKLQFNDDKKTIVSEIIGFNNGLSKSYKITPPTKNEGGAVTILYKGASWGDVLVDADLKFVCPSKDDKNLDVFNVDKWNGEKLQISVKSKAACNTKKSKNPKKPSNGNDQDNGESWGWFTWIFIFMVLFSSIYIIGGAWYQYNKGNAIDFQSALKEVLENFIDLLKGLPTFIKEIIDKFTGGSRGEYSAV